MSVQQWFLNEYMPTGTNSFFSVINLGAVVLIGLFVYYQTHELPCQDGSLIGYMLRSLIHVTPMHLLFNLYNWFQMGTLENQLSSGTFLFLLLVQALLSNLIMMNWPEEIPKKLLRPKTALECSIGLSGILIAFELIQVYYQQGSLKNSWTSIQWILVNILPHFITSGVSFYGHISGFISGLLTVLTLELTSASK